MLYWGCRGRCWYLYVKMLCWLYSFQSILSLIIYFHHVFIIRTSLRKYIITPIESSLIWISYLRLEIELERMLKGWTWRDLWGGNCRIPNLSDVFIRRCVWLDRFVFPVVKLAVQISHAVGEAVLRTAENTTATRTGDVKYTGCP